MSKSLPRPNHTDAPSHLAPATKNARTFIDARQATIKSIVRKASYSPEVLVIFDRRHEGSVEILSGIERYQLLHGPWSSFLVDVSSTPLNLDWLAGSRWRGVISCLESQEVARTCATLSLPLVNLSDLFAGLAGYQIHFDNQAIGQLGAEHFLERDFKRFGFCGFFNNRASEKRHSGFSKKLAAAGAECRLLELDMLDTITPAKDEQQITILSSWLRRLPRKSAVMACNDILARQVVRAAQVAGLSVPEGMAVLGVGNDPIYCRLGEISISSVAVNAQEAGHSAAATLDRLMSRERQIPRVQLIAPEKVIVRESTDLPPTCDPHVAAALDFIRVNACRGISVEQVANKVQVARCLLEVKFHHLVGRSLQAEIRRVQINRIKQLLTETDLPMKLVAQQSGFVHVEYMQAFFKRLTGETPGRYRKAERLQSRQVGRVARTHTASFVPA